MKKLKAAWKGFRSGLCFVLGPVKEALEVMWEIFCFICETIYDLVEAHPGKVFIGWIIVVFTILLVSGVIGVRCDRVYTNIQKHDDFCYFAFRPKELR